MKAKQYPKLTAILLGGVVGGTVDIASASLISGLGPETIMQAVASGLIGKGSFFGGAMTAGLGLFLQLAMSVLIAAIYLFVVSTLNAARRHWQLTGVIAGAVIFFVMTYLVVPLSAAPFRPKISIDAFIASFVPDTFFENLLAMILFGLIIAFFARRVFPPHIS